MTQSFYTMVMRICQEHNLILADSNRKEINVRKFNKYGFALMTKEKANPTLGDLKLRRTNEVASTPRRRVVCLCSKFDGVPLDIEANPDFMDICREIAKKLGGEITKNIEVPLHHWEDTSGTGDGGWLSGCG